MSEELQKCPSCESPYGYESGDGQYTCSSDELIVLDANGARLQNGDSVVVVKDLPVKGAPKPVIKAGTKVKNIRLNDGDHNIDCKIDGFGAMGLKSEFVKKA